MPSLHDITRAELMTRKTWLDYATLGWNALAAIVAITAGIIADSIVLTGFGLESIIGTGMAGLVIWRLHFKTGEEASSDEQQPFERRLLFIFGISFFLLALYIMNESGSRLYYREKSETSVTGLVLSVFAVTVISVIAALKFRTAKALDSKGLNVEAKESATRVILPVILFFGLWLPLGNRWWADPIAALFMIFFIVREGWKAIEDSKGSSPAARRK